VTPASGRSTPPFAQPAAPSPGDAGEVVQSDRTATIGPDTCASGTAEPMDLELAVDAMLSAASP
jgi:hypothetical protein